MATGILVIGRGGQLAHALARLGGVSSRITCLGRSDFNLAEPQNVAKRLCELAPEGVINAAAYNAVDQAERDQEPAFALNRDGPAALARACAARDIPLVHVSTDYVFDGLKPAPYVESDPTAPLNAYGRSKAEGEAAIADSGARAAIIRTSRVFGAHGANFVRKMIELAARRDEIAVVADQIGRPTWAPDLAAACLAALGALRARDKAAAGILHYCGADDASWADMAEAVMQEQAKRGGAAAPIRRIASADYPAPARRPANSRLDCAKLETALGVKTQPWRARLALCMDEIYARASSAS